MMSEYTEQADKFLADSNTTFAIVYLYTGPYFDDDDKEKRDVYQFTLSNARGIYSAKFGNSINNTEARALFDRFTGGWSSPRELKESAKYKAMIKNKSYLPPTAYDVLAGLTKYDPGTFADFCADYGYDTDSRKAEKTYFAVQEEWAAICRMFTAEQISQLQEIR